VAITRDLDEITALRVMPKTIEATCYNHVRLALSRLGNPLRVDIPDHRGLDIILSDQHWLCVDNFRGDQPILAWLDFDTRKHNTGLHEPVTCQLRLYHMHAGLIMGSALDALHQALQKQLAEYSVKH
jgi:hypothetical protein